MALMKGTFSGPEKKTIFAGCEERPLGEKKDSDRRPGVSGKIKKRPRGSAGQGKIIFHRIGKSPLTCGCSFKWGSKEGI